MIIRASVCLPYFFSISTNHLNSVIQCKTGICLLFTAGNDYLLHGNVKHCQGNPVIVSKLSMHMNGEGSNYK